MCDELCESGDTCGDHLEGEGVRECEGEWVGERRGDGVRERGGELVAEPRGDGVRKWIGEPRGEGVRKCEEWVGD